MSATSELLETLHGAVAQHLLDRVNSGEATASEVAQAVKLLKDNGIEAVPKNDNPLGKLSTTMQRLPFTDPSDEDAVSH